MIYYQILSMVLFTDDMTESAFLAFIKPFEECLEELSVLPSSEAFRQDTVKVKKK